MSALVPLTAKQRGGLLRGALCAAPGMRLVVCDFSGIEARVLAWLAEDHAAIDVFRRKIDPYKRIASEAIFFVPVEEITKQQRAVGKVAELALGYQMGWRKFEANAGKAMLESQGVTAQQVVDQWRNLRQPVVDFWERMRRGWVSESDMFHRREDDGSLRLTLPSGRELVYRDATREGYRRKEGLVTRVYGGLLTENLVQAASRCLLAHSMVLAHDAGLRIVTTVHDEIVCEEPERDADEALEVLEYCMSEEAMPDWAEGCPITCEGYTAERYRK